MFPEAERAELRKRFGRTLASGEPVYTQGDAADLCYLVDEGMVALDVAHSPSGAFGLLGPGDLFGEDALSFPTRRSNATALVASVVVGLPRVSFGALLCSHPEVCARLFAKLATRAWDAETRAACARLPTETARVAAALLWGRQNAADKPVSLSEAGRLTGLATNAVGVSLRRLAELGFVVADTAGLRVADWDGLAGYLEECRALDASEGFPWRAFATAHRG